MVVITPISSLPVSNSTEELLVLLTEGLCLAYSTSATIQPLYSLSFVVGDIVSEAVTSGTTTTYSAIVPIDVIGTITYLPKGACKASTKLFAETFNVGFTGLTAAPTTVTVTTGVLSSGPANVKCCNRAYGYNMNTVITVTAA